MNKNNKVTLNGTTDKPVLTYKIYYWDYINYQQEKKLLYVGKAYNFNNAANASQVIVQLGNSTSTITLMEIAQ